jgi:hypothetical protein
MENIQEFKSRFKDGEPPKKPSGDDGLTKIVKILKEVVQKIKTNRNYRILTGAIAIALLVVIASGIHNYLTRNHLDLSNYITVKYHGADGYATAECIVDTEKIYNDLAGEERNMEKLTNYRKLANSITATISNTDIANGSHMTVETTYDANYEKVAGIKVVNAKYKMKASGISKGDKINLYDNVNIIFAGISPEAYVMIDNHWDDDYLKSLSFSIDKNSGIAVGDTINVICNADQAELARHGFIADTLTATITADRLSTYAKKVSDIDMKLFGEIVNEDIDTIYKETKSTSFRMLYKVTKDPTYLYAINNERADDTKFIEAYMLSRKNPNEGNMDNYLYLFYETDLSNQDTAIKAYFVFEYTQGYITADGEYSIDRDRPLTNYYCGTDYDILYQELINEKNLTYYVNKVR